MVATCCTTTTTGPTNVTYYAEGDIPAAWLPLVRQDKEALHGVWELLPARSESVDALMAALGFGMLKRSVVRNFKSRIEVHCKPDETYICTHLPMGTKKDGTVFNDGRGFDLDDPDTGCCWHTESLFVDGRLLQRRTSKLGVMYDVRCVFDSDPESKCGDRPLKLFRWTFIDNKGKVYCANRWSKKLP